MDFGLSRLRYEKSRVFTNIQSGGRLRYLAPELTAGEDVVRTTEKTDIYAFAMVIYELLYQCVPFHEISRDYAVVAAVERGTRPSRVALPTERLSSSRWSVVEDYVWFLLPLLWSEELKRARLGFISATVCRSARHSSRETLKPSL